MATEVKIPAMGESITSGILAAWHVNDGDYVEKDQPIYELETDKITSEANADASGAISLKAGEGDEVEVGQIVAVIDETASAGAGAAPEPKAAASDAPETGGETASEADGEAAASPESAAGAGNARQPAPSRADAEERVHDAALSPAARKAAEESGVDLSRVVGTGKDGRITKADILEAAKQQRSAAGSTPEPAEPEPRGGGEPQPEAAPGSDPEKPARSRGERETRSKMSPLRRKIAQRMVQATQEAAMLTTFNEADMSAVMKLRKQHQDNFTETHGVKLGFMSFFIKAVVQALKAVPAVNARIEGDAIVRHHYYDVGVAVGTDRGLMVPVVRDCDAKSFAGIEQAIVDYSKAAREGKIKLEDLEGGVFTISNGGIYGSLLSTPIINYPQPAILGLHKIQERPVVVDGEIVARPMMYLAVSYDHRLIDGKEAVTFLVNVKEAIEDPTRLLFEV